MQMTLVSCILSGRGRELWGVASVNVHSQTYPTHITLLSVVIENPVITTNLDIFLSCWHVVYWYVVTMVSMATAVGRVKGLIYKGLYKVKEIRDTINSVSLGDGATSSLDQSATITLATLTMPTITLTLVEVTDGLWFRPFSCNPTPKPLPTGHYIFYTHCPP